MEDQKKKSIVYLLQGPVDNIRNKTNWQLQGYLHLTLQPLEKVTYCVYNYMHLMLDPKRILILFLIGFANITPP